MFHRMAEIKRLFMRLLDIAMSRVLSGSAASIVLFNVQLFPSRCHKMPHFPIHHFKALNLATHEKAPASAGKNSSATLFLSNEMKWNAMQNELLRFQFISLASFPFVQSRANDKVCLSVARVNFVLRRHHV